VISDSPTRDVDEVREMGFQYLVTGATPGHGDIAVKAVNVPVSIAGMDASPGDIIHMDENGAVKFPAEHLGGVLDRVRKLMEKETAHMARLRKAADAEEIIRIISGA